MLVTIGRLARLGVVMALAFSASTAFAVTEIQWWHSMTGKLNDKVNEIADKFNASQTEYKVVPVYKGQYDESMAAAIAAYRAGNPPQIVQVFEVGTATMMAAKGAIKPVYQLMAEADETFDPKAFLGAVYGYYADTKGNLMSMPFNSSTQVLYINDDAFKKAGLDPVEAAADLARGGRSRGEAQGLRHGLRLHHRLAVLGAARELQRLAQRAVRAPRKTASAASTPGWNSTARCR